MVPNRTIVLDLGAIEWRCGFAEDDGPEYVREGVPPAAPTWEASLSDMLEELEVSASAPEHAVLLSERPGASDSDRTVAARALFDRGIGALLTVAAPLLALYSCNMDTGVLVDVGSSATCVLLIFEGRHVLDTATLLPHEASGDLDAIAEAILRCLALVDMSVRGALLGRIVLVGGGTMAASFVEGLSKKLEEALCAEGAPWRPHVVANAERRLSCWLGGATVALLESARALFVTSDAYQKDAALVHTCALPLACRPLATQEATQRDLATSEAAAVAELAHQAKQRASSVAAEARAWWVEQAPAHGTIERSRQRSLQQLVVRPLYARALSGLLLQLPTSTDGAAVASDLDGTSHSHASQPGFLPPAASLALAASAMMLLYPCPGRLHTPASDTASDCSSYGDGGEDHAAAVCRRVLQLLAARWASSAMNALTGEDSAWAAAHRQRAGWSLAWVRFRASARSRAHWQARMASATCAWQRQAAQAAASAWTVHRQRARAHGARVALAERRWGASRLREWAVRTSDQRQAGAALATAVTYACGWWRARRARGGWARWVAVTRSCAAARRLMSSMAQCFVGWRTLGMWMRFTARQRRNLLMDRVAQSSHRCAAGMRGLRRWMQYAHARAAVTERCAKSAAASRASRVGDFWSALRALAERCHRSQKEAQSAVAHHRRCWQLHSWGRLRVFACAQAHLVRIAQLERGSAARLERCRLRRLTRTWQRFMRHRMHFRRWCAVADQRRLARGLSCFAEHVHYARVTHRVRLRRIATRLRVGIRERGLAALRRGMQCLAWWQQQQAALRASERLRAMRAPSRERRRLAGAVGYWAAEAQWRRERARWMQRQMKYMNELHFVLENAGGGQRWAQQLLSIGVEPHAWSDKSIRAVRRSSAALERALRRESRGGGHTLGALAESGQRPSQVGATATPVTQTPAPRKKKLRPPL